MARDRSGKRKHPRRGAPRGDGRTTEGSPFKSRGGPRQPDAPTPVSNPDGDGAPDITLEDMDADEIGG